MEFAPEGPMAIPLWINGRAYLTVGERFFDVVNPVTGEALRRVPLCGAEEATTALLAARDAQAAWGDMPLPARAQCLAQLADALERYAGHFAKLLTQDLGIEPAMAEQEVGEALAALRGMTVGESGVCALIVDASRPLAGLAQAMAPALLAGATLVIKPSPKAPSVAFALCELSQRAGWPGGVLNLLQGDTAAIKGLCAAGADRLCYAGAPELGAQVAALAEAANLPFSQHTVNAR